MSNQPIKINGRPFPPSFGRPISFVSKRTGKTLAGIDIEFVSDGQGSSEMLENLFSQPLVSVIDPFVGRSYQALMQNASHRYTNGHSARHFCEIREVDAVAECSLLEIEGHQFPVAKYTENDVREEQLQMVALLRLSREQYTVIKELLQKETVLIRRVGVDENPLAVIFGGSLYWSKHEEDGETYYKQILTFLPRDAENDDGWASSFALAITTSQAPIIDMALAVSARFEALVDELTKNNLISKERRDELVDENWEALLDQEHIKEIKSRTRKICDAEKFFDTW